MVNIQKNNIIESILFLVGLTFFIYSMNVTINDDVRYFIYLRSQSIFLSILVFLYAKNCEIKYTKQLAYVSFIASLWHIKDLFVGSPYQLLPSENIFITIIVTSTIILLFRQWHEKK